MAVTLENTVITLPSAPTNPAREIRLALRRTPIASPTARPVLLVHGLASNAEMWDGVAELLSAAGHPVVAVDQRGHGRSAELNPALTTGYTTADCAQDLVQLTTALGWTGSQAPILAGQSWGGNVVLAAARRCAAGLVLVDGGWLDLGRRFASFADCWRVLAPPRLDGLSYDELRFRMTLEHADWPAAGRAGSLANLLRTDTGGVRAILRREYHREILHSMWAHSPTVDYPTLVAGQHPQLPTLLLPAGDAQSAQSGPEVEELLAAVPHAQVRWLAGAHHDLHAQHPEHVATNLRSLAAELPGPPGQLLDPANEMEDA